MGKEMHQLLDDQLRVGCFLSVLHWLGFPPLKTPHGGKPGSRVQSQAQIRRIARRVNSNCT